MTSSATSSRRTKSDVEAFAVWLGTFFGAVLKQLAPVLAEILAEGIKRAFRDTVEDGVAPADLRARLAERVRDADRTRAGGGAGPIP